MSQVRGRDLPERGRQDGVRSVPRGLILCRGRVGSAAVHQRLVLEHAWAEQRRQLHCDQPWLLRINGQHQTDTLQSRHYGAAAEDGPLRQVRGRHLSGEQWQHGVRRLLRWKLLPRRRRRRPAVRGRHLQQRHWPRGARGVLGLSARRRLQHWRDRAGHPGTIKVPSLQRPTRLPTAPEAHTELLRAAASGPERRAPASRMLRRECDARRPWCCLPKAVRRSHAPPPQTDRAGVCAPTTLPIYHPSDRSGVCTPGTYADETGLPTCALCQPGEYQPAYNSTGCLPCAVASYCPGYGTTSPTPCSGGTWSNVTGLYHALQCIDVESGFWAPTGSGAPKACPMSGFTCPGRAADEVNDPPGSEPILVESGQSSVDVEVWSL